MATHITKHCLRFTALLAGVATAATGCIRIDADHCIFNGGDYACSADRICITEIVAAVEVTDEGDGCVDSSAKNGPRFDEVFVHVQYGLPSRLSALDRLADDVQSVAGILDHAVHELDLEPQCEVNEDVVRGFESQWREVDAVRRHIDHRPRVREDAAALSVGQVMAIDDFNAAIDEWLEDCAGSPSGM